MSTYLKPSLVRRLAHERNKRVSAEFVEALDRHVASLVERSCAVHNGGRKTIGAVVLSFVIGKIA